MAEKRHTLVAQDGAALVRARPVEAKAVRSRRIFKGSGMSVTRLSLDGGQVMKEHAAPAPILIHVLTGHAVLDIGTESVDLPTGSLIHLDAHLPHSVLALTATHLLLTRSDAQPERRAQDAAPAVGTSGGDDAA
jgi:quercetin dioxygenase-like cupin family protein